ncbi:MAG: glycosyltransferase family 2 protein [Bacteroidia bacterium]
MRSKSNKNLWEFREALPIKPLDRFILLTLTMAGIISIINFTEWWFHQEHIANYPLFVILSLFFGYVTLRIILVWINYLRIKKIKHVPVPAEGLSVAIFTTSAPGEPLTMFEKTFEALNNVIYPHTTYLLDSTCDPAYKEMAEKYGVVWLESAGLPGAKAGKINAALKKTTEEFILILDPDHIVFPNFLHQTLGFFQEKDIGFVQVSQAYYNQYRSFTAAGAAEQTYTFYGPTQMGLFGYGCAVAIGANCTFRRKALESIGGHAEALAEDLVTSLRIHSAGWQSIYNPVIVSRGLVPEDLGSFCKQQLKWSRGTFEVLFSEIPKVFRKLTFWQKLVYCSIGTYYLVGLTTFFFITIPFLYFFTGVIPGRITFVDFLIKGSFIVIVALSIYAYAQKFLCHPKTERGFHWRGMILKYSCWPVFLWGFLLSLANSEIPYIPTAKKAIVGYFTPFARPLILYCLLFIITVTAVYIQRRYYIPESELMFSTEKVWGMMGFSFIAFVQSLGGIFAAYEAKGLKEEEPWSNIDVTKIKI